MDRVLEGVSPQASAAGNLDEQVGLPPASSSSESVRGIVETLREAAENENFNLHAVIQRIPELLDAIKMQKESQKKIYWPTSAGSLKLKDFLLETVNSICSLKDVLPAHAAKKVVRDVVQGLGQAHWVTSVCLLGNFSMRKRWLLYNFLFKNMEQILRIKLTIQWKKIMMLIT